MKYHHNRHVLSPENWGLETGLNGELLAAGIPATHLASQFGTPLHVVHQTRLEETAAAFVSAFSNAYAGKVSVHFAFKSNPVPGVVDILRRKGLKAEVMSRFELALALRLGFAPEEIIVNGPFKPDALLEDCLNAGGRLVIADSIEELIRLNRIAGAGRRLDILLRVNPDVVPKGMNSGTATGSRKGCAFGLDLNGGEVLQAIRVLDKLPSVQCQGLHFHIGSGIHHPEDYYRALLRLQPLVQELRSLGHEVGILDIGGGFGTPLSREMTTPEMLWYQAFKRLPAFRVAASPVRFEDFAKAISRGIEALFPDGRLPELIAEPGRSMVSSNQMLLVQIQAVKSRPGIGRWLITDGGIGTVAMPVYYEFHQVFLCNEVHRPVSGRATINGPGCFAADVIYYNMPMSEATPGEILAIMDSGAYFTSWESNFGFPRPAVIAVQDGEVRLLRRRERFADMMARDVFDDMSQPEAVLQPTGFL